MGFANAQATANALTPYGIRVGGYRWRWALGLKGGTFPPHFHQNGDFVSDAGDFEALPGEDVNGDSCACNVVPIFRDAGGRFAKPGLTPVFQPPPVTASLEQVRFEPLDLTPLYELLAVERPTYVTVPDGAIVVNIPPQPAPVVHVEAARPADVRVSGPTVNVEAPNVTVEAAPPAEVVVNVAPADLEPTISPSPVPVTVTPTKPRHVTFNRGPSGLIESAEVTG